MNPICLKAKAPRQPQDRLASLPVKAIGDAVSGDILELKPLTNNFEHYISILIDHFSNWVSIRPLKDKSSASVLQHLKDFATFLKTQAGVTVHTFRTDNGREYESLEFKQWIRENRIKDESTASYSSAQNSASIGTSQ